MELYPHQIEALQRLKSGNILFGNVGSGKSITAIAWYFCTECGGEIEPEYLPMNEPKPLYIITTAKKRDDCEWEKDLANFLLSPDESVNLYFKDAPVIIDSWNNIKKYVDVKSSVFIFDEQRLVGSGAWVKAFYKIAKNNHWILLTGTPGDSWQDYIPIFVANGFYKNKTDFSNQHIEWDTYSKFPKVKKYHNGGKLLKHKNQIVVRMNYAKGTNPIHKTILCKHDENKIKEVIKTRWNIYKNEPIQQVSGLCYILRRIVNENPDRIATVWELHQKHPRIIIFYNFNYELDMLRQMCDEFGYEYAEWNGQKHEPIPTSDRWLYLVQYTAGNEGWNCTTCSTMVFYSANYSYKIMTQAAGRIDRMNTPYKTLYYYHLTSNSIIDKNINAALSKKKKFNERLFEESLNAFAE